MFAIELRAAVPDDAAAVADYHDRCFAKTYAAEVASGELQAPDLDGTRQQLEGWFQAGSEFETYVAVDGGVPVGHFTIYGHQLVHLFVEPGHQGTGLGRSLLEQGEAMIVERGHTELELHTRIDNHNAIAFYLHKGWTMTDRLIHTDEHGISYDEHVLVKHYP